MENEKDLLARLWEAQDKILTAVNTENEETKLDLLTDSRQELVEIHAKIGQALADYYDAYRDSQPCYSMGCGDGDQAAMEALDKISKTIGG